MKNGFCKNKLSVTIGHLSQSAIPQPSEKAKSTLTQRNFVLGSEINETIKNNVLQELAKFGESERQRKETAESVEEAKQSDVLNDDRAQEKGSEHFDDFLEFQAKLE